MFTPGPLNIVSMNNAKNVGFKKGLKFNFGVLIGGFIITVLCLLFTTLLYNMIPKIQFPMKILGAAYMVYLIVKIMMPSKNADIKNTRGSFLIGLILSLTNPKAIIFLLTVTSMYILPYYNEIPVLLLFAFILTLFGFTATICWALFGSLFSMVIIKYERTSKIIMTILLLYCAISLFLQIEV
jgi:threonine/homoserine/homoserine lactone efflux protein